MKSWTAASPCSMRLAIKDTPSSLRLLDTDEIFFIEAADDQSLVRTSSRHLLSDRRSLAEWEEFLDPGEFFRVHRSYLVNLARVRLIRRREGSWGDWEVKLAPPVNKVLHLSREMESALMGRLGL